MVAYGYFQAITFLSGKKHCTDLPFFTNNTMESYNYTKESRNGKNHRFFRTIASVPSQGNALILRLKRIVILIDKPKP